MSFWTPARDALLMEIAKNGGSYSDVADRLGCTRDKVAGRAFRLKVKFASKVGKPNSRSAANMKALWADPAYRADQSARVKRGYDAWRAEGAA